MPFRSVKNCTICDYFHKKNSGGGPPIPPFHLYFPRMFCNFIPLKMSPRSILVTPPFLVRSKKKSKKYATPFSEILDPPLVHVLVVADGPGAGLRGGGGFGVF